jgi:adenylosuccinate synthase
MLLDVLSGLDEVKICAAYEIDGRRVTQFPSHIDDLRQAVPVYETLPGWKEDLTAVRSYDDLPQQARAYLDRIGELLGRRVSIVSVGPDRAQTILRDRTVVGTTFKPCPPHPHPSAATV